MYVLLTRRCLSFVRMRSLPSPSLSRGIEAFIFIFYVWCEGEVAGLGKLPDGVYVLPFFPLKKGMILQ